MERRKLLCTVIVTVIKDGISVNTLAAISLISPALADWIYASHISIAQEMGAEICDSVNVKRRKYETISDQKNVVN